MFPLRIFQSDKFIKQVNEVRCCATPGCKGALTPVYMKSVGLGGAVSIIVMAVVTEGRFLKRHPSTCMRSVMPPKLVLLYRWLLS